MRLLYSTALLLGLAGLPADSWPLDGLDGLTTKIVRTLQAAGGATPREVLLSATDCHDATTQMSLPLALRLREELREPLRRAGYRLVEPRRVIGDVWVLQCQWKRSGERLTVTFAATPWSQGKRGQVKVFSARHPVTPELADSLQPDLASYGRTLVHRLALHERLSQPRHVYLRPLLVSDAFDGRQANDFFNAWLRQAVAESNLLIPIQAEARLTQLDKPTLRLRGIRPRAKLGMSLTGDLLAAGGELSGRVVLDKQREDRRVHVESLLCDKHGQALAQATVDLPLQVLPQAVATELEGARAAVIAAEAPTSRHGLQVELSTNRGEGKASYRMGEQIAFLVRVNRDAFVYLFDIDAAGGATLLYPAFDIEEKPLPADQLLLLPDDGMSYELEVTEPPGKDLVWAVATAAPLDLPAKLSGDWAEAETLMRRVREMGKPDAAFADAQLLLHTVP